MIDDHLLTPGRAQALREQTRALGPLGVLARGYCVMRTASQRQVVRSISQLAPGAEAEVVIADGSAWCAVERVTAAELGARKRTWDVNRDLTRAVSPPNGGKATLWSPATGSTVAELSADGTAFRALAFSPDGQYLVGLCDQSWVWVWDASTGKLDTGRKTRLAARPAWDGNELGAMTFDPGFTRLVITTDSKTGSWDVKTGAAADPVKRLTDGELLNMNYRLRCETGGTGTFSVFRDDFPLRACQLKAFEGAGVTTWCLSTDRALLAAASNRKVQTWRLKYPDK